MSDTYKLIDHPFDVFLISFIVLWVATMIGRSFIRKYFPLEEENRNDFNLILGASLTLLGLIIGFSFSMATNRYDQRKNYEEQEANAIGTEYVRADLLPSVDAAQVRTLLKKYLDQRIRSYVAGNAQEIGQINADTTVLQASLWASVVAPSEAHPTAVSALTVSGMNDVLNSQGYSQAAEWNRIPPAAWLMMAAIAIGSNLLVGYGLQRVKSSSKLMPILPFVVSIAFMLIADIDSTRQGVIRVVPQNLLSVAQSLNR